MQTARKKISLRPRLLAAGRATNWEMGGLRKQQVWRDTRWTYPWSSLADVFHPRSAQEYRDHDD